MKLGEKLKSLRSEKEYTLKQLASITGLSFSFISDIEHGRRNPNLDNLKKITEGLGISISDLFDEIESPDISIRDKVNEVNREFPERPEVKGLLNILEHATDEELAKISKIIAVLDIGGEK